MASCSPCFDHLSAKRVSAHWEHELISLISSLRFATLSPYHGWAWVFVSPAWVQGLLDDALTRDLALRPAESTSANVSLDRRWMARGPATHSVADGGEGSSGPSPSSRPGPLSARRGNAPRPRSAPPARARARRDRDGRP